MINNIFDTEYHFIYLYIGMYQKFSYLTFILKHFHETLSLVLLYTLGILNIVPSTNIYNNIKFDY